MAHPFEYYAGSRLHVDSTLVNCPPKYQGSRASLEAILRKQVRQPEYNIRWMAGTVIGVEISESGNSRIKAVTVRTGGAAIDTRTIEAALVVGV